MFLALKAVLFFVLSSAFLRMGYPLGNGIAYVYRIVLNWYQPERDLFMPTFEKSLSSIKFN
jgi:hypothetical protein